MDVILLEQQGAGVMRCDLARDHGARGTQID